MNKMKVYWLPEDVRQLNPADHAPQTIEAFDEFGNKISVTSTPMKTGAVYEVLDNEPNRKLVVENGFKLEPKQKKYVPEPKKEPKEEPKKDMTGLPEKGIAKRNIKKCEITDLLIKHKIPYNKNESAMNLLRKLPNDISRNFKLDKSSD